MDAKAQVLEQQGKTFHGNARALRRKFCMQSYRLAFLIFLILAVIAVSARKRSSPSRTCTAALCDQISSCGRVRGDLEARDWRRMDGILARSSPTALL